MKGQRCGCVIPSATIRVSCKRTSLGRQLIDYPQLAERLETADAAAGAAEAAGVICGLCCAGRPELLAIWMGDLFESVGPTNLLVEECKAMLQSHQAAVVTALDDPELGFAPLLPDDAQPLWLRTRALADWSAGFLYGLGLAEVEASAGRSDELGEVLRDLSEINRADPDTEAGEEDEYAYAELVEYLRVAALLIRDEIASPGAAETAHDPE